MLVMFNGILIEYILQYKKNLEFLGNLNRKRIHFWDFIAMLSCTSGTSM